MSSRMDEQYKKIKKYLSDLGTLALEALSKGSEGFQKLDQKLAEQVVANDDKMDALDDLIEAEIVRTIAQFQPVAADIRKISVYLRVVPDLRRIGRYGFNMAQLTQKMKKEQHFKKLVKIPEMARIAVRMTEMALKGLFEDDAPSPLQDLIADDELVDAMMDELFRELVTYTAEDASRFTVAMYYLLAGRYLERAEDHAVSIGYLAHYMKTGKRTLESPKKKK